jgi:serine/threonine protein kinase
LIDFGVARAIDATAITQTGMVVGTPAFMSPEQAAGGETGPPSDVFSLALVLVYAATGRGPFGHATNALAMLRRISDNQPDVGSDLALGPLPRSRS